MSAWFAPAWSDPDHRAWVVARCDGPGADAEILHRGRNTVWAETCGDEAVVCKRFGRGNVWKRLAAPLRQAKSVRSAILAAAMRSRGIDSPEPLAAVDNLLVCRRVQAVGCAGDLQDPATPQRDERLRALGAFLARCRVAGVRHRDCNGGNILALAWEPPAFTCIDTNRVSLESRALLPWFWTMLRLGFHDAASATPLLEGFGADAGQQRLYHRLSRLQRTWWWLRSTTRPLRRRLGT